uniref:Kinase suppressor of Ras 1-like n=1 Tax=Gouania willdenowi TaxID=441366 RepID=A0A8C5EPC9_GOUWI
MYLVSVTAGSNPDSGFPTSKPQGDNTVFSPGSNFLSSGSPGTPLGPTSVHGRSISISVVPYSCNQRPSMLAEDMLDAFTTEPNSPPNTRTFKTCIPKQSYTPPPPSRRVMQLFPNIALARSKSQESQLTNRIEDPTTQKYVNLLVSSPQTMRRDIGLAVTHRFSTKSWLSQMCQVCCKSMMFGVKCKHCKLKCHNKCTKEAPSCRISFLTLPRMRRAESVPSDISNRIDNKTVIPLQFGTLPKAVTKSPVPIIQRLDSSSNPSSATSSTPSSPANFLQNNTPSVTATSPINNHSPTGVKDDRFKFPGAEVHPAENILSADKSSPDNSFPSEEFDEDGLKELPSSIYRRENLGRSGVLISRKVSQTSIYLQEWDIPYEQLQLGELIGKGRWGKVHKGRWHGEVAIRLLEIDGTNQDHLKVFKKEVMNYRQTRHENVVLFMGACLAPPHLAIITSFCKGLTLYTVVRERGHMLDLNKTRQIAQDIVKGMGYLHAKGIIHKDLKSKNVFYDTNRVVITDFGLFGIISTKIPRGWLHYLAPEIVQKMSPEIDEDQLPFSKPADVYAFGTIWYELQVGDWPITDQPVEARIWLVGSNEGIKKVLAETKLGKEVTEILSTCWSPEVDDRPTFTHLADMLERLPKLNRRLSHPGHFWKSYYMSKFQLRFSLFYLQL